MTSCPLQIHLLHLNKAPDHDILSCFRGTYEQIAIQNNHNDNSHTLAQIHIQVNTKDPIQLRVAKWAMKRSLTERCIVKLLEAETTVKAVKRKRARESDESSQKEPRMSQ